MRKSKSWPRKNRKHKSKNRKQKSKSKKLSRRKKTSKRKYRSNAQDDPNYQRNLNQCKRCLLSQEPQVIIPNPFLSEKPDYERWEAKLREYGISGGGLQACSRIAKAALEAKNASPQISQARPSGGLPNRNALSTAITADADRFLQRRPNQRQPSRSGSSRMRVNPTRRTRRSGRSRMRGRTSRRSRRVR